MTIPLFQTGWNYSQDGPGNRLLFHVQGCNFRCPWCSNPEGMAREGSFLIRKELLKAEVCPHGAISAEGLNRERCNRCRSRECLGINRNEGIRFSCTEYETAELIRQARESKPLFFDGGGVTVTGGEATGRFEALEELLRGLKEEGIHTALETNGSHKDLAILLPSLDLLILDLKHWDFEKASPVLGSRGAHVWDNLHKACSAGTEILARITVIPGFNDEAEDMEEFARRLAPCTGNPGFRLELLFYHEYGRSKWDAIGLDYHGPGGGIDRERQARLLGILKDRDIPLVTT